MAIVKEFVQPSGARIIIRDDAYAGIDGAERARREANYYRVAAEILQAVARRAQKDGIGEEEATDAAPD